MAKGDVGADGVGKEKTLLIDNADLPAESVQVQVAQIPPVGQDAAPLRIVEARDQTEQRALAGAGQAKDADDLARLGVEGNVAQHRLPGV